MPSSEQPGTPGPYPVNGSFAALLDWHLKSGTRPNGQGKFWISKDFDVAVTGVGHPKQDYGRLVRLWRSGERRPTDFVSIARELFGQNQTATYVAWRNELWAAYSKPTGPDRFRHVPLVPVHFLGRDTDVAAIVEALTAAQRSLAVLVQGGPGIGKTALTKAVGNHSEIVKRFGTANRWFVELETAVTATAMQDAIIRTLGSDPARGFQATLERLRRAPGLLVLDNLETPWEPLAERSATESVLAALAAVPGMALLASFRGRDHVAGIAWTCVHPVTQLDPPFATELFCRIANWQHHQDPDLPHLIKALGGVPLAIELVAARASGGTSIAPLWERWVEIGVELAKHPEYGQGRLTSVPHSIELSLASSRLTPAAYRLFCLLGLLPAGLAKQDRDALLGDDGFDAQEVLRRIGLVVDHAGRVDLLPPIRDHAARHHKPNEAYTVAWPAYYLKLTKRLGDEINTRAGSAAVSRLVPELANIEAAIRTAIKADCRSKVMAALPGFGMLTSIAALPAPVLTDLADACRSDGDILGEGTCIRFVGDIAFARSDYEEARQAYEKALPLFCQGGFVFGTAISSVLGEANCIHSLGLIALARSEHDQARRAFEKALSLFCQVGSVSGEANCIHSLGNIALDRSNHDEARRALEKALSLHRQVGSVSGEANCIYTLGDIAFRRSDHDEARRAYEKALSLYRQVGSVSGEANCIYTLGDIALRRSDLEAAHQAFEKALPLNRQIGSVTGEANCIYTLGDIALRRSDHDEAQQAYEKALLLYRYIGSVSGEANCTYGLGNVALARANHEEARRAFEKALSLYRPMGDAAGEAVCAYGLGSIALARSDYGEARRAFEKALCLYRRISDVLGEANCICCLGEIALERSAYEDARQAFEKALSLYPQVGDVIGEASCIYGFGEIALRRLNHEDAQRAYEKALLLFRQVDDVIGEAKSIYGFGSIALARSDYEDARQAYEKALSRYRRAGNMLGEAKCIYGFGSIALARSDYEDAQQVYEKALFLFRQVGSVSGEAKCIYGFGEIALGRLNREDAQQAYTKALSLFRQVGDEFGEAKCIKGIAQCL